MNLCESITVKKEKKIFATFEIEPRKPSEDFTLETLIIRHKECQGGMAKISFVQKDGSRQIKIVCARCRFELCFYALLGISQDIASIALDPSRSFIQKTGWWIFSSNIEFKAQSS